RSLTVAIAGEAYATAAWTITDGVTTVSGSASLGPAGSASISADASALADGTLRAIVALTDRAGNTGASSAATVRKDATPPAPPTLALDARDDSGASSSDYVTNVRAP